LFNHNGGSKTLKNLTVAALFLWPALALGLGEDPGKPDLVYIDSATAKRGADVVIGIKITADDSVSFNGRMWQGVGNFCIPLKYDSQALHLDSVQFVNTVARWDEHFTNLKIDTGFVSFAGIYFTGGEENPVFFSPDQGQEVIKMFFRIDKKAKKGMYKIEQTIDPIQKNMFLGSPDGMHSWAPGLTPGKITVK